MDLSAQQITDFQAMVMRYYHQQGRHDLPWRLPTPAGSFDPYPILVSEIMLQQTQVSRVIPKFSEFMQLFPSVAALADSSLAAVLTAWSGLGYNRRAKFLHEAAKYVAHDLGGVFPATLERLVKLPGVGKNTAGAILAYAYNQPAIFVETNIRTVYFYHFFQGRQAVTDAEIAAVLEKTLVLADVRNWYWAVMDYGAYLKQSGIKLNSVSKHYAKQSPFEGSKRQVRGQVIRSLALQDQTEVELARLIPDARLPVILADLLAEQLITKTGQKYHL